MSRGRADVTTVGDVAGRGRHSGVVRSSAKRSKPHPGCGQVPSLASTRRAVTLGGNLAYSVFHKVRVSSMRLQQ